MPLTKKQLIRLRIFLGLMVLVNAGIWYYFVVSDTEPKKAEDKRLACDVKGLRRTGYKYTKPLLMLDRGCDDPSLDPLRDKVLASMASQKQVGNATSISVYFRLLDSGKYFNTSDEEYSPGSLMKVMTLITYLKEAQSNPSLLKKQIVYNINFKDMPSPLIPAARSAEMGKTYTVEQLLDLMITQSDNNATSLLNQQINMKVYNEVLTALQLPIPDPHQADYPISAEHLSRFFRLLYNSSFLSPEMSDRALELLSNCAYDAGFNRYLKGKVQISHKFGERNVANDFQLHEGGIFYLDQFDYLLIVMTRGSNQAALQNILADIANLVYQEMLTNYGVTPTKSQSLTINQSSADKQKG